MRSELAVHISSIAMKLQPSGELVEPRQCARGPPFDPRNKSEGRQAQDCVEAQGHVAICGKPSGPRQPADLGEEIGVHRDPLPPRDLALGEAP
jgi:hypothetical protein